MVGQSRSGRLQASSARGNISPRPQLANTSNICRLRVQARPQGGLDPGDGTLVPPDMHYRSPEPKSLG